MSCLFSYLWVVSFEENEATDQLQTSKGWKQFTSGWLVGSIGGASFAFMLLSNFPISNI